MRCESSALGWELRAKNSYQECDCLLKVGSLFNNCVTNLAKLTRYSLSSFANTFLSTIRETIVNLAKYELPDVLYFSHGLSQVSILMLVSGVCLRLRD